MRYTIVITDDKEYEDVESEEDFRSVINELVELFESHDFEMNSIEYRNNCFHPATKRGEHDRISKDSDAV